MCANKNPGGDGTPRGAKRDHEVPSSANIAAATFDCTPDLDQARRFLHALDPTTTTEFVFQTLDDNSERDDDRLRQVLHGGLERRLDELIHLNTRGAGIFVTINRATPNRRRRLAEDITKVRAVFLDLDGAPLQPVLDHPFTPHIVNLTSPGKYHAYWLVDDVPLDQFAGIQEALAERFNGDPVVCDLPRVMRLPGFYHRKRDPFLVKIVSMAETPRYPGAIFERKQTEPHISSIKSPATYYDMMRAIAALLIIPPSTEWKRRNYIGMAMWRASAGDEDAF